MKLSFGRAVTINMSKPYYLFANIGWQSYNGFIYLEIDICNSGISFKIHLLKLEIGIGIWTHYRLK